MSSKAFNPDGILTTTSFHWAGGAGRICGIVRIFLAFSCLWLRGMKKLKRQPFSGRKVGTFVLLV